MAVSPEELARWREGIGPAVHMNAAGASPTAAPTHAAVLRVLERERQVGGYAAAAEQPDPRAALAALLNASGPGEIALVESAQVGWARALGSLALGPGDRIVCWECEYAGNAVGMIQAARRSGAELKVLPMRPDGMVDLQQLDAVLAGAARSVVALCHLQTDKSTLQPAEQVGQVCRRHRAVYLLDACQSAGLVPLDVQRIQCSFACGTGRKWLRGPRGSGFLYARSGAAGLVGEPSLIDHHAVEWTGPESYTVHTGARRYEMWEGGQAARVGLGVAAQYCLDIGPSRILARATSLADRLRAGLAGLVEFRDAPARWDGERAPIVVFVLESVPSARLKSLLAERQIYGSVTPGNHSFDQSSWRGGPALRLSPSYYNTELEVDAVVAAIKEIAHSARGQSML